MSFYKLGKDWGNTMPVHEIILNYWAYYAVLIILSSAYCFLLYKTRSKYAEAYRMAETLIVTIFIFYVMVTMSPIISPDDWAKLAWAFVVAAIPIIIFSGWTWAGYLQDLINSIGKRTNATEEK